MAKRNEAAEHAAELIEQGVSEVFTSGKMAEYLTVMSRFHNYSARNCLLIMMQMPEATHVAGYRDWQNKFHRQVRKGEKSIRILAPISHKRTIRETNKDTGETKEREAVWYSYRAVPVFDVSQTEGDELPTLATDLLGDVDGFSRLCDKVAACAELPVEWDVDITDPDCHGFCSYAEGRIAIRGGMSEVQTFKTLVHETAHSILHGNGCEQEEASRKRREVQAEGVAFVVCKALGIDSDDYSFGYLAAWGGDTKEVLAELEVIRKTANAILDKVV